VKWRAGIGLGCALVGAGIATAAPVTGPATYDPISAYRQEHLLGWRLLVNEKLVAETNLCRRTLELLQAQLAQITNVIPAVPLRVLRDISIWVERSSAVTTCAAYHQSYEWLRTHGVNPEKTGAVEIGNPENFLQWTQEQPWMVLHELAHGYHQQFLGEHHPGILRCYEAAKASGKYDLVWHGRRRERHYALTNDKEYFAECTEAFFGRNDFQPYTREELRTFDPQMYQLLFKLWNLPEPPP
jgi:hypothetical protein